MKRVKVLMMVLAFSMPVLAQAAVTREINGVKYSLYADFDTADGECALRGANYASMYFSMTSSVRPIVKLNADGSVREIISKEAVKLDSYEVIQGLSCQ
jgi:hypothetical protein